MHLLDTSKLASKFSSKTVEIYMIGYSDHLNTYRVWDPKTNNVIISSDVVCSEHSRVTRDKHLADRPYVTFTFDSDQENTGHDGIDESTNGDNSGRTHASIDLPEDSGQAQHDCTLALPEHRSDARQYVNEYLNDEADHVELEQLRSRVSQVSMGTYENVPGPTAQAAPSMPTAPARESGYSSSGLSHTNMPHGREGTAARAQASTVAPAPDRTSELAHRQEAPSQRRTEGSASASSTTATADTGTNKVPASTNKAANPSRQTKQGGLSPGKIVERLAPNFQWSLKDRTKRSVNSKYARVAKAVDREPNTYTEAINAPDGEQWKLAIAVELNAHIRNNTWRLVPKRDGLREISAKWIFKIKRDANGNVDRYKARFVARGFTQIEGVDYEEIYSPVVNNDSLRLLFALSAQYNLVFKQFDIATAFLYGEVKEELYVTPPEGLEVPPGHTCRLVKALYGLKQAPKCFNERFCKILSGYGLKRVISYPCVFVEGGDDMLMLALYVDDGIVFARNHQAIDRLLKYLSSQFDLKVIDKPYFFGVEITHNHEDSSIFLHQTGYAKRVLERFSFQEGRSVSTPVEPGHSLTKAETLKQPIVDCPYQEVIGSLNYLAKTRPDLVYTLSLLSKFSSQPREAHWKALKRVVRYIRGTLDYGLLYKSVKNPRLVCYTDADYAGDQSNSHSTSGMVSYINTGPISFRAQQQQTVSLSTTEAEFVAAAMAVKELSWMQALMGELRIPISDKGLLLCDNQSAIHLIKNRGLHQRTKHIAIKWHFIREKWEAGDFQVEYVETDQQKADIFTKPLAVPRHAMMRELIGCVKRRK